MNENEAILRRYVGELNRRNFAILDEVVAPSVIFGPGEIVSRAEYRRQIEDRIARLPDYHVTIDELWCDGDAVGAGRVAS
jgi:predicted ester cyclase